MPKFKGTERLRRQRSLKPADIDPNQLTSLINAAKAKIKATGLFSTTDRIAEETGLPWGEIVDYFESRIHNDIPHLLLRGMMYQGPLSHTPYYGPIQVNNKGDWRPRRAGEPRIGNF